MQTRLTRVLAALTALLSVALVAAGPAPAVTVDLRIEGKDRTIFEGQVDTEGHSVKDHKCDGTNGGAENNPGPTVTSALDDGADEGDYSWDGEWFPSFEDFLVDRIGPDEADESDDEYWGYLLNYKDPGKGGCQQRVSSGDRILWAYDAFGKTPLKLSAPSTVPVGQDFTVTVVDGRDDDGFDDAHVAGRDTDSDGNAVLRFDTPGRRSLKATGDDAIRSNEQVVCVLAPGQTSCGEPGTTGPFTGPITGPLVSRLLGVLPARRYSLALAPRLLRGQVTSGGVPVTGVRIRLRRYLAGGCWHYSLRLRRFHRSRCTLTYFFYPVTPAATPPPGPTPAGTTTSPGTTVTQGATWSYTLPARLAPGAYTLEAEATDAAGRRHRGRVVFHVVSPVRR